MKPHDPPVHQGEILEECEWLTLAQLSAACQVHAERIIALIDEGIVEPSGSRPGQWRFPPHSIRRVRVAIRLECDLGLNPAGAALVLELREELARVKARLRALEGEITEY